MITAMLYLQSWSLFLPNFFEIHLMNVSFGESLQSGLWTHGSGDPDDSKVLDIAYKNFFWIEHDFGWCIQVLTNTAQVTAYMTRTYAALCNERRNSKADTRPVVAGDRAWQSMQPLNRDHCRIIARARDGP